jgi:hypothetical protein
MPMRQPLFSKSHAAPWINGAKAGILPHARVGRKRLFHRQTLTEGTDLAKPPPAQSVNGHEPLTLNPFTGVLHTAQARITTKGTSIPMLSALTVNRSFMHAFIEASAPCFALGLVEEQGRPYGFLALRPEEDIPPELSASGFRFGHSLYGSSRFEVRHLAFEFDGFQAYNVLLNPSNALVRTVLDIMVEGGDYFFFALSESGHVAAFRTQIGQETLSQVRANLCRIRQSTTTESQYELARCAFEENPESQGVLLHWVCRDNIDYLDLSEDRLDLTPA